MENSANGDNKNFNAPNQDIRKTTQPDNTLPYEDPAIVNPEELASFPKPAKKESAAEIAIESENHLVNRRSPVREGRNIVRTDNNPNNDGFM